MKNMSMIINLKEDKLYIMEMRNTELESMNESLHLLKKENSMLNTKVTQIEQQLMSKQVQVEEKTNQCSLCCMTPLCTEEATGQEMKPLKSMESSEITLKHKSKSKYNTNQVWERQHGSQQPVYQPKKKKNTRRIHSIDSACGPIINQHQKHIQYKNLHTDLLLPSQSSNSKQSTYVQEKHIHQYRSNPRTNDTKTGRSSAMSSHLASIDDTFKNEDTPKNELKGEGIYKNKSENPIEQRQVNAWVNREIPQ